MLTILVTTKKKAIEDNIWEENHNNILLGYEYIAIKNDK